MPGHGRFPRVKTRGQWLLGDEARELRHLDLLSSYTVLQEGPYRRLRTTPLSQHTCPPGGFLKVGAP